ncbi:bifunctional riboflavin kinase/FAD synthetase [Flagellatimonas centrodinii]|uniref:bifunctional riboflavin kinase/FAD synthetase n=1 Tax=Flagellatimonas centrodinii TaxID=2806210 RepID=UPI001FEE984A|nr:bifunctional riboflavin kinase/FAD synthetase [Flagellatimonas centrodinii]ULQ46819.1 bifunctional riboflavin kinase/FAD synthetase [Flagellatimonas centrodinii]
MKLIRGQHNAAHAQRPTVVTIGNFDGVHRGHQALIARARAHADRLQLPLTVLTFEPTPREYFAPDSAPPRVTTLRTKLSDLAAVGVDQVLLQRFHRGFAEYSPRGFVDELLRRDLDARAVVVGDDFRYGRQRQGDYATLQAAGQAAGFIVDTIDTVALGAARCSSTRLRAALAAADLTAAAALLGRPFQLLGRVRGGLRLGRTLDMPTANIPLHHRLALRHGVYAVTVTVDGHPLPAVANLGVRPTLGGTPALLEAHCLVPPGDLYGQQIGVTFRHFLRAETRFASLDALKAQMHRDRDAARDWLQSAADDPLS